MGVTRKNSMSDEKKQGLVDTERLLQLWSQLVAADRLEDTEFLELFDLLRSFMIRSNAVRSLSLSDREDLMMQFFQDKLLESTGARRAPENEAELNAYVRNFSIDWMRRPAPLSLPPEDLVEIADQTQKDSGCSQCGTDELAAQSVAANKRSVISGWLQEISAQERDLLWFVHCMEEAAVDVFGRLSILNGASKVKSLGLRLSRAHKDGTWSPSHWLKTTQLGRLFRKLSIGLQSDMQADARQALRLICEALTPVYQGGNKP